MKNQGISTTKARRCTVQIGNIALTVFHLPDGSYRLSQTEVAGIIHKPARSIFGFLRLKQLKALLDNDFEFSPTTGVVVEGSPRPITPIPIEMALLYWHKWAQQGNTLALALVLALAKRSIYEAVDQALGVKRSKEEQEREMLSDLSDSGVARIAAAYQSLEPQTLESQPETQTERELKLKIRLAELELEREKLWQDSCNNSFAATDINRVGVPPWQVIPWATTSVDRQGHPHTKQITCTTKKQLIKGCPCLSRLSLGAQKTLGWASWALAGRLLHELGYGYRTEHWFKLKIIGELWVMPSASFDSLKAAVEQFKSDRN